MKPLTEVSGPNTVSSSHGQVFFLHFTFYIHPLEADTVGSFDLATSPRTPDRSPSPLRTRIFLANVAWGRDQKDTRDESTRL